jgi:hypothetical protein
MTLGRYLELMDLSEHAFAKDSGVPQTIVNRVRRGHGCSLRNAIRIQQATGGRVNPEDIGGARTGSARRAG